MIEKINVLKRDELVRGSFILFFMIVLYNLFNYVFQISMAKFLGPADYGILAVLMSIIYVFSIPSEAIQTIIAKYTSIFLIKREHGKVKDLLIRSLKKGLLFALVLYLFYAILSIFISHFLDINNVLILITGLFIFIVFLLPSIRGFLQGSRKFFALGSNLVIESLSKLLISLVLVYFGWKVFGAVIGVVVGTSVALLLGILFAKKVITSKREKFNSDGIYKSSIPIVIATVCIVLMYSLDIILARRFFAAEIAGQYAFVSLIGKTIIFVSSAIGKAMFPISTGNFERGVNNNSVLKKSLYIVTLLSALSLMLYLWIPKTIVRLISLGSPEYLAASPILFNLGLAYSLISMSYIIFLYKLSQNKMNKSAWFLVIFLLIQSLLLFTFNDSLVDYSQAILSSALLIFLYSLFLVKK